MDYKSLSQKDLNLTKKIHNIKNSLFIISGYIKIGKYDKALKKIYAICDNFNFEEELFITGNPIIDSFFQYKIISARKLSIKIHFDNRIHKAFNKFHIEVMDFCTAIGNAIDNAIEACVGLDSNMKKLIEVKLYLHKENYLCVQISNPINQIINIENNHIQSTKEEKLFHGLGIICMKDIVKKYKGKLELSQKENIFYLKLVFKTN